MNFPSPYSAFLALAFFLLPFTFFLLSAPPSAFATCYCATPTADQCKCTASPPAGVDLFDGNLNGVAVKCTSQAEANSTFEQKNAICGGATETIPYCAPEILDPSRYRCYGRSFIPGSSVDPQLQGVPDGTWKEPVVGPFYFNTFNSPSGSFKVYVCDSGLFCCTDQAGICNEAGIPKGGSCTPQDGPGNPAICENIAPPGPAACDQIRSDEPHPLRPNPGAACVDKPDWQGRLSCASDFEMRRIIDDPVAKANPLFNPDADPEITDKKIVGQTEIIKKIFDPVTLKFIDVKQIEKTISYTRIVKNIDFKPEINHLNLDYPIAGAASRNCRGPAPAKGCYADRISDPAKLSNYTSWYHQGIVDPQIDEVPPAGLAELLAKYMNTLIQAKQQGKIPGNVKLLSPAFNLSSNQTPPLFAQMEAAGADFAGLDGFAGNTYTLEDNGLKTAYFWYAEFMQTKVNQYGKPIIFTEFGDFRTATQPKGNRPGLIAEMKAEFDRIQKDGDIKAILYFAAIDSDLSNPSFAIHRLSDAELAQVVSPNRTKSGASSGLPVQGSGAYADAVKAGNLKWSMEIAYGQGDAQAVIGAFNRALDQGLTPVLRICAGNACAFSDPQVYAEFLKTVAEGLHGRTFWAIAGPNEPERETWVLGGPSQELPPGQPDWLTLLGPIRKLIPAEALDSRKEWVIDQVLAGKSYNQIIAYARAGNPISRQDAIKTGFDQVIRIGDMDNHRRPNPADTFWYTIWNRYMPFTANNDLPGRIFTTISTREINDSANKQPPRLVVTQPNYDIFFPHVQETDIASDILQSIFLPPDLPSVLTYDQRKSQASAAFVAENFYDPLNQSASLVDPGYDIYLGKGAPRPPFDANPCNVAARANTGDILHDEAATKKEDTTVKAVLRVTKPVIFTGKFLYDETGTVFLGRSGTVPPRGPVSGIISIYVQNPPQAENVWDRLVRGPAGIFKALFPFPSQENTPSQSNNMSYYCGPDCQVVSDRQTRFPNWGAILDLFHQKIQCMLNPLGCGNQGSQNDGTAQCVDNIQDKYPSDLIHQIVIPSAAKIAAMIEYINQQLNSGNQTWVGNEFEARYQDVIDFGVANNLNPVFLLALWLEETHAGAVGDYPLGCGNATTLDESLNCIAEDDAIDKYRDAPLPEFLCRYSDGHYPCTCQAHPNFVPNLFAFYNQLAP